MKFEEIKNIIKKIAEFTSCSWDRYIQHDDLFILYGWIKNKDKRDFVTLLFFKDNEWYPSLSITSNSKFSKDISDLMGFCSSNHVPCKKFDYKIFEKVKT